MVDPVHKIARNVHILETPYVDTVARLICTLRSDLKDDTL